MNLISSHMMNIYIRCFSTALSLENKDQQRIKGMIDSLNNQDNEFNDDFDLWLY